MKLVRPISVILFLLSLSLGLFGYQGRRQQFSYSYGANVPSEFYWSRLQYNTLYGGGGYRSFGGWAQDYPKADNDCLIALRRLTRINSPSPLNVADLNSDHLFDYPWVYAINVQSWTFTDEEAKRLHDYLMKGGFLMVDHFHGTDDWEHFMAGMRQVLPDAQVEDLKDADEIYHVLYNIDAASPTRRTATWPSGGLSAISTGASWWRSATTCILATPGNTPMKRNTPRSFRDLRFASSSITLPTR